MRPLSRSCVAMCMSMHQSTIECSEPFTGAASSLPRCSSYLELLHTFRSLLSWKTKERDSMHRYNIGLEKLVKTEESVHVMQKELEDLQPELVRTTQQVDR